VVAIEPGQIFTTGPPDVEVVSMTAQANASTQCAGNVVVGLAGTRIDFSYFLRLTGSIAVSEVVAYIVDMSTGATLAQVDVTARMPTAANDSYTQVTASMSASTGLVALNSYWLPFCFTTTSVTTRGLVARAESSIGLGGVSSGGGKTTVGACSGGPSCKPAILQGNLATVIVRKDTSEGSSSDGGIGSIALAAGVAVPVALGVAGVVAGVVTYIAYTRSKGRLRRQAPVRRRSSITNPYTLEMELQRVYQNDVFEMDDLTRKNRRKLNKESWETA
jgi:hypothetical protein